MVDDVDGWAAARPGLERIPLAPARTVVRELPRTVEAELPPVYRKFRSTFQHARSLVPVDGARVVHTSGLVVLPDGGLAAESVYGRGPLRDEPANYRRARSASTHRPGQYFSLLSTWSRELNYYHWLHDTVLRLHLVMDHLPDDVRFIVPDALPATLAETLAVLGIADRTVAFGPEDSWEVDRLWFAPPTVHSGHDRRDSEEWLRDRFFAHYGVARGNGRRIFVSRRDAGRRRITDEEAVEHLLLGHGFETFVVGSSPLRRQVETFASAEIVVATHGAALTNLMFAPMGTRVIEVVPPSMAHNAFIYWSMADELGHEYWYLHGDDRATTGGPPDTAIPLTGLVATLERIGIGPTP